MLSIRHAAHPFTKLIKSGKGPNIVKEIIYYPGSAVGCERIVKEILEIISYLIAQIENVFCRLARDFDFLRAQKAHYPGQ